MLPTNIIKDFINEFNILNCRRADIRIRHLLYGNQKINKCTLHPFTDGERIGIIIDGEEKYINIDELCEVYIDDKVCCIKSEVMELHISF